MPCGWEKQKEINNKKMAVQIGKITNVGRVATNKAKMRPLSTKERRLTSLRKNHPQSRLRRIAVMNL
jgi:hypothetical protein